MNIKEKLLCIKKINPGAHCVVWEGGIVKYDIAHVGAKPTEVECEAVLKKVQADIAAEELNAENDEKVRKKSKEMAAEQLKIEGKLSVDYAVK